ncbi:MAG: chemotaxis protein CheA [Gammaproteobacteria bacterium]|nr:chemotaxis protein CheA [Gammaproteobacteria bacterium]
MSIDMSQFLQTFYEESFEGLEIMESSLLNLDPGSTDEEVINTIFRAAHSIKGGSATFGLSEVASFTHVLETLLDEMRDGRREVTGEAVNLLLQSVDVLREMLTAKRDDQDLDQQRIDEVHQQLEALLNGNLQTDAGAADKSAGDGESASTGTTSQSSSSQNTGGGWKIVFRPFTDMFRSGNDPVRMFRELQDLGEIKVKVDSSRLPEFADLDPEESHCGWTIELSSDAQLNAVEEVFAWVDGDCELEISPLALQSEKSGSSVSNETEDAVAGELVVERRKSGDRRKEDRRSSSSAAETASIRVGIDKVDAVINLVGELVITQSMLSTLGEDFRMDMVQKLTEGLGQLERNTRELQEEVMRMRMLPISFAFNRFPRMVHDVSQNLSKNIELKMIGEQTELDKTVIEKIGDPLVHLVRNSLDHGIETPEERVAAGKPEMGTLTLNAYHKGGNIIIEVQDDGRGLNTEKILAKAREKGLVEPDAQLTTSQIHNLIFLPGFSTADVVSDVSGRGVGMDVVRRNIQSLGGTVDILSETGKGSTITVRLPLTLAILDGQTVAVGNEVYIVPLVSIIESMQVKADMVGYVAGKGEVFSLRDEYLPVIRMYEIFGAEARTTEITEGLLVVVEGDGKKVGLFVDELQGQQQVVIKSLEANYKKIEGISGATILGDGSVALILDVPGLMRIASQRGRGVHDLKRTA